jgi:hypothetical protein
MNKITKTNIGDEIHFYTNGVEGRGIVAKMSSTYITVFKEDGKFYDIPINDTFYVSDILINKTWNNMSMEERSEILQRVHSYSPRLLIKSWEELPFELRDVLKLDGKKPKKILTSDEKNTEEMKEYQRTNMNTPANQIESQRARMQTYHDTKDEKHLNKVPEGVQSSDPQYNTKIPSGKAPKIN